ncbi:hypothetical protein KC357_g3 [Hortaea werneckii]|nr:hypothetical protein KC357_g3 [Hortaea werneckii]
MPVRCCPSPFKPVLPLPSTTETFTSDICFCQTYLKGLLRHVNEYERAIAVDFDKIRTDDGPKHVLKGANERRTWSNIRSPPHSRDGKPSPLHNLSYIFRFADVLPPRRR